MTRLIVFSVLVGVVQGFLSGLLSAEWRWLLA